MAAATFFISEEIQHASENISRAIKTIPNEEVNS
jgi:hypothetical protein